jgi:protein-tyrosine phosphatase
MIDYSLIKNGIFIGNYKAVIGDFKTKELDILESRNIKIVISALTDEEYEDYMIEEGDFPNSEWHRLVIDDDRNENISQYFSKVHKIISEADVDNKNVIVHCAAGISRSATLVLAYLMIENKWEYEEAYLFLKSKRPIIEPNVGFITQLRDLESTF